MVRPSRLSQTPSGLIVANVLKNIWLRLTGLGIAYCVIGYGSTLLDHPFSGSIHFWRLAAWVASAIVFFAHLGYEHFRIANSPAITSLHVGLAVAIGGLLLAVAATSHAVTVSAHAPYTRLLIAWVAWPVVTGAPAFLTALVVTLLLRLLGIPRRAET